MTSGKTEKTVSIEPIGSHMEAFRQSRTEPQERISTGILSLDKALNGGLVNELYIIGAETSTGKSALMMALARNAAATKCNVLYFSLEMGQDEHIARGISAISFEQSRRDPSTKKVTASDILYWKYEPSLNDFAQTPFHLYENSFQEYFHRYGDRLFIIESGTEGLTVSEIVRTAADFKEKHPDEPVLVFVDYLQIIKPDASDRAQSDRKTKTDIVVTTLKTLASQVGMPVIAISSIGRSGYNRRITTGSFKESGDTEYTGGVLMGWNWEGVTNAQDEHAADAEKERCRKNGYRNMTLEILKYRNAERDNTVHFRYYPAYSYFEEGQAGEVTGKKSHRQL